ncbi:MAG: hypothetical protein ILP17_13340, partial [Lachnospiraceae bacterium]|nr:hypothetical protein [Lachnospiraceae bacterium]
VYVGGAPYVSRAWDDETQSVKSTNEVYTETVYNIGTSVGGGWYYVYGKKDIGRITLSNNTTVNIILADGAELKCGGIFVPENTILNIYGQKNGTGKLIAKADEEYQAGIGGNDETGHGQINIYGGTIEATGNDYGAGIGSGDEPGGKSLGDIQIFGGNITAQGGEEGAGIGGGNESKGANIYIYGGYIVARGDNPSNTIGGAGIGGGDHAGAGHIEIKGGTIRATGGRAAAGIGGGPNEDVNNGDIIISGGDINAAGGYYGAGIGSGINSDFAGTIIISGGEVDAYCELNGAGIGAGSEGDLLGTITISGGEVRANAYGELKVEKYVNEVFYKFSCGAGIGAGASGGGGQNAQITISGGSVYSKSDYGGAAIGAGSRLYRDEKNKNAGAFLGTVTISGGDLKLWANTNRLGNAARLPETIGRGVDCGSDYGTVIIGDGMCVARETDYPVSYSDRENASRSYYSGATIIIEPCNNHTVDTFTSDSSSTHSGNCKYCNEFVEENHKMQGNTCTVCGYVDDSIVKVTVAAGDGTGTSVSTWETIGDEYTLPECSFTAPSGKVFEKWTVKSGTSTLEQTAGDIITINGETTITAQYRTLNEYTIRFVNYDDNPLSEIKVTEGQLPEYSGAAPSKPGDASYEYVFAGWDKEIVLANANAVYKATFNEIGIDATAYEITFVDDDGNVLWSDKFKEGTTPAYPLGTPTKEADAEYTYSFDGWTPGIDVVTEDKEYTATFAGTKRTYTILFINEDGTLLQSIDVEYGDTPVFDETITPLKVSDEYYTYEFDGWDKEIAEVTGEAVYTAQFKAVPKNFDIRFVNYDDSLLQYVKVPYGTMPSYTGDTPVKPGDEQYSYTFLSWTPSIEAVEGAATYKATYYSTTNKYTVTFENEDGTVLQSQTLEYGEMPSYKGSTPEKEEDEDYIYSFAGWDAQISKVTEDVVYTATYNAIEKTATVYTIKFVNDDGTVLQTVKVAQGDLPEYTMGTDPVKKADNDYSYEFTGWTPAVTKATADATYKATYKATPIKQVYNFVEGSPSVYVQGSGEGLVETVKCTIDDPNSIDRVLWVAVDGTQLTLGKEYSLKQGSTIVTLFSSYLDTLSAGEHVLLVNFTDGSVSMKFTIEAKNTSGASIPATGEEMNTTNISIALLLVAASLGCMKYVVRTKRREEEK